MMCRGKKAAVLGRASKVTAARQRKRARKSAKPRLSAQGALIQIPARSPPFAAFGCRLLLFADRTTSAISIPPPQQIPSKWPLRKLLSALPRRTSPWALRSARVRHSEPASSATTRDPDNRHAMQKLQKPGPLANNMSLQASSSSALPASSPRSTTLSSTSLISGKFPLHSGAPVSGNRMDADSLSQVVARPSAVSPVA